MKSPNALTVPPQGNVMPNPGTALDRVPTDWAAVDATEAGLAEVVPREVPPALRRSLGRVADQAVMPVGDSGNVNRDVMAFSSAI